jgi:crossover junction endodeoxyribonuclease RuvC
MREAAWRMFAFRASQAARGTGRAGEHMRILGIDPGLRTLGWGVIEADGGRIGHLANGLCHGAGETLAERLLALYRGLRVVIETHAPDCAAIEQTFVNRDGAGSLKLGQARGVALLAAAESGLPVGEYAPNTVKKTIVGTGHAAKRQIDHMVRLQLPGVQIAGPDAADALAVALCHAHHGKAGARLAAALARAGAR